MVQTAYHAAFTTAPGGLTQALDLTMNFPSAQEVAERWIVKWSTTPPSGNSDGFDLDWELPRSNPVLALESVLEVLRKIPADPENHHFQVLAAGPIEDIVVQRGLEILPQLLESARQSPALRLALGGAWIERAKPEVLEALEKLRISPW